MDRIKLFNKGQKYWVEVKVIIFFLCKLFNWELVYNSVYLMYRCLFYIGGLLIIYCNIILCIVKLYVISVCDLMICFGYVLNF